jgi:hypothetical protein
MPLDNYFEARSQNYPFASQVTVQEKDIEYVEVISYLLINSSDRNVVSYPKVNNYRIDSDENFRNIHSIELVAASVANQGSPLNNPYLILKIDGLDHLHFSNKNVNKGFSTMYLKYTTGPHVQPELGVLQRNILKYKTPLASLSSFTISILKPDGSLFDFGESNGDVTPAYSNSFMLKIITLEKSRKDLRNLATF